MTKSASLDLFPLPLSLNNFELIKETFDPESYMPFIFSLSLICSSTFINGVTIRFFDQIHSTLLQLLNYSRV